MNSVGTDSLEKLSHVNLAAICSQSLAQSAWNEFYQRFDKWIHIYVRKALRGKNKDNNNGCSQNGEIVAEIVQDVYLKLLVDERKALRNFTGTTDNAFLAYLSVICTNTVYESHRRQVANKRSAELVSMDETAKYLNICCDSYLSDININEVMRLLDKIVVGRNFKRDKLIFNLYVAYGLTATEIAQLPEFDLSLGAVQSIIHRIRIKITNTLRTVNTNQSRTVWLLAVN
ncbi:MAG: sigma-70 family RNA polymerase sigma factor [Acidobacteriota bacterium]